MATVAFVTEEGAAHRSAYQQAIRDLSIISSASLVDPAGKTFEETREVAGAKVAGSHRTIKEMLADGKPDVAIVTMIAAHAPPLIGELLDAGVPVMAEKPACIDPNDFARLADLADKRKIPLMLALANRVRPDICDARHIIASGGIGTLYAVQATQVDDQARIHRKRKDPDWTMHKELAGGGHLSWLGIHSFDAVRYLTGEEIVEVSAMTSLVGGGPITVEDLALVNYRFENGARGALFTGYLMDRKGHSSITIYGSQGWLRINAAEQRKVEWRTTKPDFSDSVDRITAYEPPMGGGYTAWVDAVVRACTGEAEYPVSTQDGLRVLKLIHAAYESSQTRRSVEVP